jgi:hypothetical protein
VISFRSPISTIEAFPLNIAGDTFNNILEGRTFGKRWENNIEGTVLRREEVVGIKSGPSTMGDHDTSGIDSSALVSKEGSWDSHFKV